MNSYRYLHVYSELLLAGRFLNYIRAIIELFSTSICVCISVYYTAMQMVCVLVGIGCGYLVCTMFIQEVTWVHFTQCGFIKELTL